MRYSTYEPYFSTAFLGSFFFVKSLCAPFETLLMNATLVEIQRIQTRLQQLGRAKQSGSSSYAGDNGGDRHSAPYLELPDPLPTARSEFGHGTQEDAGASHSKPVPNRESQAGINVNLRPQSTLSTQARSVDLNDETLKALNQASRASHHFQTGTEAQPLPSHQTSEESCQSHHPISHHPMSHLAGNAPLWQGDGNPNRQEEQNHHRAIASDRLRNPISSVAPTSNLYPSSYEDSSRPTPPTSRVVSNSYAQTQLQHHTQLQSRTQLQNQAQPHHQPHTPYPGDSLASAFECLNAKAQYGNAISNALKESLQEMGAIAQTVDHQLALASAAGAHTPHMHFDSSLVCNMNSLLLPYVEQKKDGAFVVKSLSVGDLSQQHQAENLARPRQHRSSKASQSVSDHQGFIPRLFRWFLGLKPTEPETSSHNHPNAYMSSSALVTDSAHQSLQTPRNKEARTRTSSPSLIASLIWVGGSIFVRMGLDALLVAYPILWPPAIALVVTPAAIAIYRTAVDPQSSFLLGRRLLLIMIGLLLGGRL
jgi:hypothetical protein